MHVILYFSMILSSVLHFLREYCYLPLYRKLSNRVRIKDVLRIANAHVVHSRIDDLFFDQRGYLVRNMLEFHARKIDVPL